jgi:hypothetical protein
MSRKTFEQLNGCIMPLTGLGKVKKLNRREITHGSISRDNLYFEKHLAAI